MALYLSLVLYTEKNIKSHFMAKQGSPSSIGELSEIRLYVEACE